MKKIGLLILLCVLNLAAFAQRYFPNSIGAPAGSTTSYCAGDFNAAYTATVTMCGTSSGIATDVNNITAQWYWNGALVYTDPVVYTPSSSTTYTVSVPAGVFMLSPAGLYSGALGLQVQLTSSYSPAAGGCTAGPTVVGASTTIAVATAPAPVTGLDHVCIGATIALADATSGGTWSIAPASVATINSATGVVTGVGIGGAAVTYTVGGCSSFYSISGDPNPAPISPSSVQVCEAASTTLTDVSGGGTWVSDGFGVASVGSSTGIVTGTVPGVATISYVYPGSGCYATASVTVNQNPAPIAGSAYVCQSSTTPLTDATIGGSWLSAANSIATVGSSTGIVSGVTVGGTTITYRMPSTGCFITAPVTVSPAPAPIVGDSLMCAGGTTVSLSDTVAGGTWTSGSPSVGTVSSSGTVTSTSAGTTTISYATPGCNPATKVVTVSPLPAAIGGLLAVCVGVPTSLYEATAGGSWISADTLVATVSPAGIISGYVMGTVSITYRMPGGCQVSAIATVNPLAPITGSDSICAGGGGYLSDIVGGGTWTSGNPSVLAIDTFTGVVTSYIAGPSYVYYTLPTGCVTSKLVTVIPQIPAISGPGSVCTGAVATLVDAHPGGVWTSSNPFVATINDSTGVMITGTPDTVAITYTTSGIGCAVTTVITVNPLPIPLITFSSLATHTLSTFNYYTSYQWYDSTAGLIPGATTMSLVIPAGVSEYYYVVVTDNNGCTGSYGYNYVTHVGVANLAGNDVKIYPNPAADKVTVSAGTGVKAVISDMAGRKVIERENATEVSIGQLAPGVYMISLFDEQGTLLAKEKLVKQ